MSLQTNTASLMALLESVNALPDRVDTSGTATAADIYTGKTATVNDTKLTGTNPYNAANVDPAVTAALAAIAEKGVDTTGAGLADIAALVAGIQAGGGGMTIETGSYTPAQYTNRITIGTDIPDDNFIFLLYHDSGNGANKSAYIQCGFFIMKDGVITGRHYPMGGYGADKENHIDSTSDFTGVKVIFDRATNTIAYDFGGFTSSPIRYLYGGATYTWKLVKM